MSQRDDVTRMRHMLDYAQEAAAFTNRKERKDLDSDRLLTLGLARLMEIIGEAANRVSDDARRRYPQISWPRIISLRNRLIHGYDSVDLDILWQIVRQDIPSLITALEEIILKENDMVERELAEALEDVRKGRTLGPFKNSKDAARALRRAAKPASHGPKKR